MFLLYSKEYLLMTDQYIIHKNIIPFVLFNTQYIKLLLYLAALSHKSTMFINCQSYFMKNYSKYIISTSTWVSNRWHAIYLK